MSVGMVLKRKLRWIGRVPSFICQFFWIFIKDNDSSIGAVLRKKIYRTICSIDTDVFIQNKKNFVSGKGACLYHSCYILNTNGKLIIGSNSHLGVFCYVNVCYGSVTIGDHVAVGPGTKIFAYSNHYLRGRKITDEKITREVIVGDNVFIGANCTILPGTTIHNNVIIGAGSVVKGELEENSIYAGVPCRKIRSGWYE